MATKSRTEMQPTADPVATEPVAADLVTLLEQKRQLDDVIKRLKAAQPQPTPLEKVIASQASKYGRGVALHLVARTLARCKVGQPAEQALREVLAFYAAQAEHLLAERLAAEAKAESETA